MLKTEQGREQAYFIHYQKWSKKWDEWVDVSHGRVAPRETYTSMAAWGRRKHNGKQRL